MNGENCPKNDENQSSAHFCEQRCKFMATKQPELFEFNQRNTKKVNGNVHSLGLWFSQKLLYLMVMLGSLVTWCSHKENERPRNAATMLMNTRHFCTVEKTRVDAHASINNKAQTSWRCQTHKKIYEIFISIQEAHMIHPLFYIVLIPQNVFGLQSL